MNITIHKLSESKETSEVEYQNKDAWYATVKLPGGHEIIIATSIDGLRLTTPTGFISIQPETSNQVEIIPYRGI